MGITFVMCQVCRVQFDYHYLFDVVLSSLLSATILCGEL